MKCFFRDLFNNRAFVLTLAAASFLFLAWSVAAPLLERPDFSEVAVPVDFPEDVVEEVVDEAVDEGATRRDTRRLAVSGGNAGDAGTAVANGSPNAVQIGRLSWQADPARDPFAPSGDLPVQGKDDPQVTRTNSLPSVPRLNALVAGPRSLLAVLDDRIVREGERIRGYRVSTITRRGVRITAGNESVWLSVDEAGDGIMQSTGGEGSGR